MNQITGSDSSEKYLMALDAGTGSIRAVIFDLHGNQVAVGQAEWRHNELPDVPGSMEFDLPVNWQLACHCIALALKNAGLPASAIAGVAACSMKALYCMTATANRSGHVPTWMRAQAMKSVN